MARRDRKHRIQVGLDLWRLYAESGRILPATWIARTVGVSPTTMLNYLTDYQPLPGFTPGRGWNPLRRRRTPMKILSRTFPKTRTLILPSTTDPTIQTLVLQQELDNNFFAMWCSSHRPTYVPVLSFVDDQISTPQNLSLQLFSWIQARIAQVQDFGRRAFDTPPGIVYLLHRDIPNLLCPLDFPGQFVVAHQFGIAAFPSEIHLPSDVPSVDLPTSFPQAAPAFEDAKEANAWLRQHLGIRSLGWSDF